MKPHYEMLVSGSAAHSIVAIWIERNLNELVHVKAQARGPQKRGARGARAKDNIE
jgi:hypothetical protein